MNVTRLRDLAQKRGWTLNTTHHDCSGLPWVSMRWRLGMYAQGTLIINLDTDHFYGSRRDKTGKPVVRFQSRTQTLETKPWFTCLRSMLQNCRRPNGLPNKE